MQAVLLAAGVSSRLYPFASKEMNKASLSLMSKTLIERTIESIRKSDIRDIIIIVSPESPIPALLKKSGVDLTGIDFITHKNAEGMGEALLEAKDLIQSDFLLLHAHHFECDTYIVALQNLRESKKAKGAVVIRSEANPVNFGVVRLDGERIIEVVEKPEGLQEHDSHRIVGMYLLPVSFLDTLAKTAKQHYSFEAALNAFITDEIVVALKTDKPTITLKYPWHILAVSDFLLSELKPSIAPSAIIAKSAIIEGNVVIGENTRIDENVVMKGPCFIGNNVYVGTNAIIRGGVIVEDNAVIGSAMEVKHSVIMANTTTHSGFIGDSVIGNDCKIAAFFCTGNVRIDRGSIWPVVKGNKVDSGEKSLGVFMGEKTKIGIRVATMPGVVIGRSVVIGPATTVYKNIADDVAYYTTLKEIIEEKKPVDKKEKIILFDIDYTLFNTKEFKDSGLTNFTLYDEVVSVLTSLSQVATLGIFSEGKTDFQQIKLLKTAIHNHFAKEHIHIVESKDLTIAGIFAQYEGKELFLIDDRLPVLQQVKEKAPFVYAVWLKRGPFAEAQEVVDGFAPDATITDLTHVLPIISGIEKEDQV